MATKVLEHSMAVPLSLAPDSKGHRKTHFFDKAAFF